MKIGIYARGLSVKSGGVTQYIFGLVSALIREISEKDTVYIIHNLKKNVFEQKRENVKEILMRSNSRVFCDFVLAPMIINGTKFDVVLFTKNVIPFFAHSKKIVTIYDLAYYFPKLRAYKFFDTRYMRFMIKRSCFAADKIIAISENTRNDLVNLFNIPHSRIETVYAAADDGYKKIEDKQKLENIRRKYKLDRKFIFYPGNISPRKNIERLINAFEKTQDKIDLDLVLTGHNMWNSRKEIRMIKKNRRIKLLGRIPDEDLPSIYSIAEVFVYVSLYEGFGIPIVEAQRCGCPVIVSDSASLPEVAGKGAIVVDPYDEGEITRAILQVVGDRSTREKIIQEGYKNAERFSWEKSAKEIIKLIRGIC